MRAPHRLASNWSAKAFKEACVFAWEKSLGVVYGSPGDSKKEMIGTLRFPRFQPTQGDNQTQRAIYSQLFWHALNVTLSYRAQLIRETLFNTAPIKKVEISQSHPVSNV